MQTYISKTESTADVPAMKEEQQGFQPEFSGNINLSGGGRSLDLPNTLRSRVRSQFGLNMDSLRVKESAQVADFGAKAMAQGNIISFAPGVFNPNTSSGREIIGHELHHITEQARGLGSNIEGSNIHYNPLSESASDAAGRLFASDSINTMSVTQGDGSLVSSAPAVTPAAASSAPVQGYDGIWSKIFGGGKKKKNTTVEESSPYGPENNFKSFIPEEKMNDIKINLKYVDSMRQPLYEQFFDALKKAGTYKAKTGVSTKSKAVERIKRFKDMKSKGYKGTLEDLKKQEESQPQENVVQSDGKEGTGGIDARDVWLTAGDRTGEELDKYYADLGSGDMKKQQPLLDSIFDDLSETMLDFDFDAAMTDEQYILDNLGTALKLSAFAQPTQTLNIKNYGYVMSDKNKEIINEDTRDLLTSFAHYLENFMRKHGTNNRGDTVGQDDMNFYAWKNEKEDREYVAPKLKYMRTLQRKYRGTEQKTAFGIEKNRREKRDKQTHEFVKTNKGDEKVNYFNQVLHEYNKIGGFSPSLISHITGDKQGQELQSFYKDMGSGDMKRKKGHLDKIYDDASQRILDFDERMLDENYILDNHDKVMQYLDDSIAYDQLYINESQQEDGYKMSKKNKDIKDKSFYMRWRYGRYVNTVLRKYKEEEITGKGKSYKPALETSVQDEKQGVLNEMRSVKRLQKKYDPKVPWYKKLFL